MNRDFMRKSDCKHDLVEGSVDWSNGELVAMLEVLDLHSQPISACESTSRMLQSPLNGP